MSEGATRLLALLQSWFGVSAKKGKDYCWLAKTWKVIEVFNRR